MYRRSGVAKYNAEFASTESILLRESSESRLLKLCNFRKVKVADFHRRNDHFKGFFARCTDGGAEKFYVAEHLDQGLVEAKVANRRGDAAVFHKEKPVSRHASHD